MFAVIAILGKTYLDKFTIKTHMLYTRIVAEGGMATIK
jgi:hypothetical protein